MLYFTFLSFLDKGKDKGGKKLLDNEALEGLVAFQGFLFYFQNNFN
jgi:hypothetical protein